MRWWPAKQNKEPDLDSASLNVECNVGCPYLIPAVCGKTKYGYGSQSAFCKKYHNTLRTKSERTLSGIFRWVAYREDCCNVVIESEKELVAECDGIQIFKYKDAPGEPYTLVICPECGHEIFAEAIPRKCPKCNNNQYWMVT